MFLPNNITVAVLSSINNNINIIDLIAIDNNLTKSFNKSNPCNDMTTSGFLNLPIYIFSDADENDNNFIKFDALKVPSYEIMIRKNKTLLSTFNNDWAFFDLTNKITDMKLTEDMKQVANLFDLIIIVTNGNDDGMIAYANEIVKNNAQKNITTKMLIINDTKIKNLQIIDSSDNIGVENESSLLVEDLGTVPMSITKTLTYLTLKYKPDTLTIEQVNNLGLELYGKILWPKIQESFKFESVPIDDLLNSVNLNKLLEKLTNFTNNFKVIDRKILNELYEKIDNLDKNINYHKLINDTLTKETFASYVNDMINTINNGYEKFKVLLNNKLASIFINCGKNNVSHRIMSVDHLPIGKHITKDQFYNALKLLEFCSTIEFNKIHVATVEYNHYKFCNNLENYGYQYLNYNLFDYIKQKNYINSFALLDDAIKYKIYCDKHVEFAALYILTNMQTIEQSGDIDMIYKNINLVCTKYKLSVDAKYKCFSDVLTKIYGLICNYIHEMNNNGQQNFATRTIINKLIGDDCLDNYLYQCNKFWSSQANLVAPQLQYLASINYKYYDRYKDSSEIGVTGRRSPVDTGIWKINDSCLVHKFIIEEFLVNGYKSQ